MNPNVPWKTRGNAALAARFGRGAGRPSVVGEIDRRPVVSFPRGLPLPPDTGSAFVAAAWAQVAGLAEDLPGTDPALVAVERPPPPSLYWNAVREVVRIGDVLEELRRSGAFVRTRGSRRGVIGASAAVAWPGRRATWELIAYRTPERWGRPREVEAESVLRAQRAEPDLFLCHDPRTRRLLVAPHSPCPILFGLRSTSRDAPVRAVRTVRSEPVDRWVRFRTNQGSGDHLLRRPAGAIGPYRSAIVVGAVVGPPVAGPGGHVRFDVRDRTGGTVPCVAFEPTKTLPRVAQRLVPGDRVRVWGSRGTGPALRLEGFAVIRPAARTVVVKPTCPACGRRGRSLGRARGYACPACGRRWPPEAAHRQRGAPPVALGTYHPTPSARRHLAILAPEG